MLDLERFHAGDRETLAAVYRTHVAAVERAVSCYCRGPAAECVVHEVFAMLIEREDTRRQFRGGDLGAWLATIARHRAVDLLRRERRVSLLDDPRSLEGMLPPVEEEEGLLHRDQVRQLELALAEFEAQLLPALDARLAEAYRLRIGARLPQTEAARRAGVARATFVEREQRMLRALGRFLARRFAREAARPRRARSGATKDGGSAP
jgi:RNA polymerase sigma-70 factor (ECF subfamily)